jgi:pilus assembly protein CpaF
MKPVSNFALVAEMQGEIGERITQMERAETSAGKPPWDEDDRRQAALAEIQKETAKLTAERWGSGGDLTEQESERLIRSVYNRMFALGEVQELIDDQTISDVHINGYDSVFVVHRDGTKRTAAPVAASDEDLVMMVASYVRRFGLSWDATNYSVDLQLPSGHRLHAIAWVADRPTITIRIHDFDISTLDELVERGTLSKSLREFLLAAMSAAFNTLIAGGTGAGKTTLARGCINALPWERRKIVIEDSPELAIKRCGHHPDAVEMHVRNPNVEGRGAVSMADLVIEALRQNPDHIIVGEFRGREVREALLAMSQGEASSISTLHADSSRAVFTRLQMYMAMCPERYEPETTNLIVAQAINFVVHIAKIGPNQRVVTSVREVTRAEGRVVESIEVYGPDASGRAVPRHRPQGRTVERLVAAGFDVRWLDEVHGGWDR